MDVLLLISLNLAGLAVVAALVVWLRFRVDEAPRLPPWIPAAGMVVAGALCIAAILSGLVLVAVGSALNVVVFGMLTWNARRLAAK